MLFSYADQVMSWYVNGKEKELANVFLEKGFDALRREAGGPTDAEFEVIFDNFVVYSGLLLVLVVKNMDFFVSLLADNGGDKIRDILQIGDKKYDDVWKVILDAILDGFCNKKYKEKKAEMASKTLDEILALLNSF